MPGKHHLRGFKIATKKIGSPLRGSWTMLCIVVGSTPPPLGKKLDPPLIIITIICIIMIICIIIINLSIYMYINILYNIYSIFFVVYLPGMDLL